MRRIVLGHGDDCDVLYRQWTLGDPAVEIPQQLYDRELLCEEIEPSLDVWVSHSADISVSHDEQRIVRPLSEFLEANDGSQGAGQGVG